MQSEINLLEELGFVFDTHKEFLNRKIKDLREFQSMNGHTFPPKYSPLGKWVTRRRLDYKNEKLSKEIKNLLESIRGWVLEEKKSHELPKRK